MMEIELVYIIFWMVISVLSAAITVWALRLRSKDRDIIQSALEYRDKVQRIIRKKMENASRSGDQAIFLVLHEIDEDIQWMSQRNFEVEFIDRSGTRHGVILKAETGDQAIEKVSQNFKGDKYVSRRV